MPAVSIASPFIGPVRKRATNSFGTDGRLATSRDTFFALLSIIRSFAFVMPRTQNYGQARVGGHETARRPSTKGDYYVATTCADDRGHGANQVLHIIGKGNKERLVPLPQ